MDKKTRIEAAALLAWWLAHGDGITVDEAAQAMYNLGPEEWANLDAVTRCDRRRNAKLLLRQISRVLPVFDQREGRRVVWQAVEAIPPVV